MKKQYALQLLFTLVFPIIFISCGNQPEPVAAQEEAEAEPSEPAALQRIPREGEVVLIEENESFTLDEVEEAIVPFFGDSFSHPPMKYGVKSYRVRFISTDFDGSKAIIFAQLFIPQVSEPSRLPLYVFGSGTTGIPDRAAPSLEVPEVLRWGWYKQNMLAYAGSGYITMFPDYLGFNDPERPQRYFSKEAEGHVMLDAVRAVYHLYDLENSPLPEVNAQPSDKVFAAGYSQGGHAAFAAADLKDEYAPDVPLTGIIGYASTNDIAALFREGVCYAGPIVYNYMDMYGRDKIIPEDYFAERFVDTFEEDASTMSVDEFQRYFTFNGKYLYNEAFYDSLYGKTLDQDYSVLNQYFEMNYTGWDDHGIPAFIVQGEKDFIVTVESQDIFVEGLKERGSAVDYKVYDGVSHKYTRMAGFTDSLNWMESFQE